MSKFWQRLWRSIIKRLPDGIRDVLFPDADDDTEPDEPSDIKWHGVDASKWPVTTQLSVSLDARNIHLRYDKASSWPIARTRATNGGPLVGNAWVLIPRDGVWHAHTFEWMRRGQQSKARGSVRGTGGHIQSRDFSDWTPVPGETYRFMVSTPARGERGIDERSDIVGITWH